MYKIEAQRVTKDKNWSIIFPDFKAFIGLIIAAGITGNRTNDEKEL